MIDQLIKKLSAFCGIGNVIVVFERVRHFTVPWTR
jgi:hypothetical protein